MTNVIGSGLLGVTLGCARCHDHKFDPIRQKDYYRIQAVFSPVQFTEREVPFLPCENTTRLPQVRAVAERHLQEAKTFLESLREKSDAAIAAYLKDHPLVASYKLAPQNEGGGGATIVELKD